MSNRKPAMKPYTLKDFQQQFPDDATCLEWLRNYLYPDGIYCQKCKKTTKHHRVASRPSYSCDYCGHHVHPTAGTIFHKSPTPLTTWFYAIYLMAQTRCGISAKQIQRETGVTYKTAWRMFKQIRSMLSDGKGLPIGGKGSGVEVDETWVGGRRRVGSGNKKHLTMVVGLAERGGEVRAFTEENARTGEGFWSLIKNGLRGVYHSVGKSYLQSYLNEYSFRYNRRFDTRPMFISFLQQVQKRPIQICCPVQVSAGVPASLVE